MPAFNFPGDTGAVAVILALDVIAFNGDSNQDGKKAFINMKVTHARSVQASLSGSMGQRAVTLYWTTCSWSEMRAYIALYSVLSVKSSQFAIRGDACAQTVRHNHSHV
jgi:hypothetical protein